MLVVEPLDRPESNVPDLAFGREADHLLATEVESCHCFSPDPRVRDRSPEPEPRGSPRVSPGVAHFERGERSQNGLDGRNRLAVEMVSRHLQRCTPPVDRRADHRLQESWRETGPSAIGPSLTAVSVSGSGRGNRTRRPSPGQGDGLFPHGSGAFEVWRHPASFHPTDGVRRCNKALYDTVDRTAAHFRPPSNLGLKGHGRSDSCLAEAANRT